MPLSMPQTRKGSNITPIRQQDKSQRVREYSITPERKEEDAPNGSSPKLMSVEQIKEMLVKGASEKMDVKLYIIDQIQKLLEIYEKLDSELPKDSTPVSIKEAKFIIKNFRNDSVAEKIISNKRQVSTPSSYK